MKGRGRKRAACSQYIGDQVIYEFDRLIDLGIPVTRSMLFDCAFDAPLSPESPNILSMLDPYYNREIRDMINSAFIKRVLHSNNIVLRKCTGNLVRSTAHIITTHKLIAYHLGEVRRKFEAGVYEEARIENMD